MDNSNPGIYGLIDPRTQKIRYIGCTGNLDQRLHQHIAGTASPVPVKIWTTELKHEGLTVTWIVLERVCSRAVEKLWIARYKAKGEADLNLEYYNPGMSGHHHNAETRARISKSGVGRHPARVCSAEERAQRSASVKTSWLKRREKQKCLAVQPC